MNISQDGIMELLGRLGYPYVCQKNMFKALGAPNNWQHAILMLGWLAGVIKEEGGMILEEGEGSLEEEDEKEEEEEEKEGGLDRQKGNLENYDRDFISEDRVKELAREQALQDFVAFHQSWADGSRGPGDKIEIENLILSFDTKNLESKINSVNEKKSNEILGLAENIQHCTQNIELILKHSPSIQEVYNHISSSEMDIQEAEALISCLKVDCSNICMGNDMEKQDSLDIVKRLARLEDELKTISDRVSEQPLTLEEGQLMRKEIEDRFLEVQRVNVDFLAEEARFEGFLGEISEFKEKISTRWDQCLEVLRSQALIRDDFVSDGWILDNIIG